MDPANDLIRVESSHLSTETFQGPQQSPDSLKIEAASYPLRRGSTGMMQRLQRCQIGNTEGFFPPAVVRSGSLPSVKPAFNNDLKSRPAAINQLTTNKRPSTPFPFAPFMSMPDPVMQRDEILMYQDDWSGVQTADATSQKRKSEEEVEATLPQPAKRSQDEQPSNPPAVPSDMEGIHSESLKFTNPSDTISSATSSLPPASTMRGFRWKQIPNPIQSHMPSPLTTTAQSMLAGTTTSNVLQQPPLQNQALVPNVFGVQHKQTVTVPATLAPEQSVSPRTQNVELPPSSFLNPVFARQMMLFQHATNSPDYEGLPMVQNPQPVVPLTYNSQLPIPRSVHLQSFPTQQFQRSQKAPYQNRPQLSQADPSDVLRKPSLYKVPPWTAPLPETSSAPAFPSLSRSTKSNAASGSSNINTNNMAFGGNALSNTQQMRKQQPRGSPERPPVLFHGMIPMIPPRTPPPQGQARSSSPSSPLFSQSQLNPSKRKHSPNL